MARIFQAGDCPQQYKDAAGVGCNCVGSSFGSTYGGGFVAKRWDFEDGSRIFEEHDGLRVENSDGTKVYTFIA